MVKVLLILGLLGAALLIFRARPSAARMAIGRLAGAGVIAIGIVAVLAPNLVTSAANLVGVGRGADLVLYVLAVTFLLTTVSLHRKFQDLEERYIQLVRHVALWEPAPAPKQESIDADQHLGNPASHAEKMK